MAEGGAANPRPIEFANALGRHAWPGIATDRGAQLLALQFQLERSQWWTPERIHMRQQSQLALLLQHAASTVPYYREVWQAEGGLSPPVTEFGRLPELSRFQVQEFFAELVSNSPPPAHGGISEQFTSGSLGTPLRFLASELHGFLWHGLTLRDHLWHGRDLQAKLAAIRTKVAETSLPNWGGLLTEAVTTGPCITLNIGNDIDDQAHWLLHHRPAYLITHPSNARALALHFLRGDVGGLDSILEVRVYGESVPADLASLVQRAWGARLSATYSSEECGYIALQCPVSGLYHVQSEHVLVEVLDDDGASCAVGETGRVVVTPLHNFAMPLIRYAIGDYAEVGPVCPCGRGLPTLAKIHGRLRNMLCRPDGQSHWPSFPAEMWLAVAPVRQFRLIQHRLDLIEIRYVMERPLLPDETIRLESALEQRLGHPFRFEWIRVPRLEPSVNHKYEDFVSEIPSG